MCTQYERVAAVTSPLLYVKSHESEMERRLQNSARPIVPILNDVDAAPNLKIDCPSKPLKMELYRGSRGAAKNVLTS